MVVELDFDKKHTSPERYALKQKLLDENDRFVIEVPKVELHVHIEGTLTADVRWKIAQRNGTEVRLGEHTPALHSLEELKKAYTTIASRNGVREPGAPEKPVLFFQAYYEGFKNLVTKEDFYDLAMDYFTTVAKMNVRYCEPFFDPQGHTSRGVKWETFMTGFREAQIRAENELGLKSQWVMCILRDWSFESAMEHYKAVREYKYMVAGIGLDSNEYDRPASIFEEIFQMARNDGFKLTAHCDVNQKDTHEHIREVASLLATTGSERIDHGLNAAEKPELMELIKEKGTGMTVCPWAYLRHQPPAFTGERYRTLYDAGIPVTTASDDPGYMDNCFILHGMFLAKKICHFTDADIAQTCRHAVNMSWTDQTTKDALLKEIDQVYQKFYPRA
ncbi:hypothetical protein KEM56_002083 [Ascosphaera pollenicola]|nr:hypothetical protein KEM56_002083 [Ascosphaera pollenicola]